MIVGGGVAALEATLALQALAGPRVGVEVVAPEPQFFYRPLLVAAPFRSAELRRYDLGTLLARAGALLTLGTVTADAVGNLRTPPLLVVAPEHTLGEVTERMCALDLGAAVVAEYGKTIGIITTRDLLGAFASRVHPSEARVRSWMTAHPFTIRAEQSKEVAATRMAEHGIHHLPIVDASGHAVAILGLRDVAPSTGRRLGRPVR